MPVDEFADAVRATRCALRGIRNSFVGMKRFRLPVKTFGYRKLSPLPIRVSRFRLRPFAAKK